MKGCVSEKRKKLLFDLVLIFALIAVALSVFLFTELSRGEGARVAVTVDGVRVAEYSLFEDGEYSLNGGSNILVIEDGRAYIRAADCPDKTCISVGGKISRAGERITCLPNRVVVEIVGDDGILVS